MTAATTIDLPLNFDPLQTYFTQGERGVALSPAADVTVDADVVLVNGEAATTKLGTLPAGTYYVSRWVEFGEGIYEIKAYFSAAATLKFGAEAPVSIPAHTLYLSQVYVPDGVVRMDITLTHIAPSETLYFAALLYQSDRLVYSSNRLKWLYDSALIPDNLLAPADDPRRLLPVMAMSPNWKAGVNERVSYMTDVMSSETGAVQTRSLRKYPRRSFEFEYLRNGVNRARLDLFLTHIGRRDLMVPLWHEQFRPDAGVPFNVSTCDFSGDSLALREFQVNDLVLVTLGDPNDFDVLEVGAIDTTTERITWVTPPTRDWPAGTKIVPMRRAYVLNKATMAAPTDSVGIVRVLFNLRDPDSRFEPSWGYCAPLWRFPVQRSDQLDIGYERVSYMVDNETGPVHFAEPGGRAFIDSRFSVIARGREFMVAMRQFFGAARGRAKRFYMPSLTADLQPQGDIGGSFIDVAAAGASEYADRVQWARRIIAITFSDGSPSIYRRIMGVTAVGADVPPYRATADRLTLNRPIPAIPFSQIERIQFVVPSRFDQDTYELQHMVDESAAVRVNVVTRSADRTGMPAIECSVTSMPYPVETVDEMTGTVAFTAGSFGNRPRTEEAIESGVVVTAGAFLNTLQTYNADTDAIEASMALTAGTLGAAMTTYMIDPDGIEVGAVMTAGALINYLVNYELDDDAIDAALTINSGTLT